MRAGPPLHGAHRTADSAGPTEQLYFTLHAARQTGKTTALRQVSRALTAEGRFAALLASCERGQTAGPNIDAGVNAIIESIRFWAELLLPEPLRPVGGDSRTVPPESRLAAFLKDWCQSCPRPVVLFLDEIDALQDETLVSVLRQLRDGFPARPTAFPHSIARVGLRDVRDYRIRSTVRPERVSLGTASPFNVKADSLTLRNFDQAETHALLLQHTDDTGQRFTEEAAAAIFEQSQGQPWLVPALAGFCTTRPDALVPDRTVTVTREHVLQVREILIERRDTHLDSLVSKLQEPRVRRVEEQAHDGVTVVVVRA